MTHFVSIPQDLKRHIEGLSIYVQSCKLNFIMFQYGPTLQGDVGCGQLSDQYQKMQTPQNQLEL